jgi:hypothetical protein
LCFVSAAKLHIFKKTCKFLFRFLFASSKKNASALEEHSNSQKYILLNINFTGVVFTSLNPRDLKQIVADPDSGIMTRGEHSHKIWVERK